MNFDFSPDMGSFRDSARRLLRARGTLGLARAALDGSGAEGDRLWQELAALGWLGAAIPEEYGGTGFGYEALCVLAEEAGRHLLPLPLASTVMLAAEALLLLGTEDQKTRWLPGIANGSVRGTLALAEGPGLPGADGIAATVEGGRLSGRKWPVADGLGARLIMVVARSEREVGCFLVDAAAGGVTRTALASLDGARPQARLDFSGVAAERLGAAGWSQVEAVLDRAAILLAFEQLGGAAACLEMATAFARERHAFGRAIGSYQAIKHKLADMFIASELARSNAYGAMMALAAGSADLALAAAAARISATEAYSLAARENIQTHGGIGFTWQSDCHLYYRRARGLAAGLGTLPYWKNRLVDRLDRVNEAA